MKPAYNLNARKRPVKLTLHEDLVRLAKDMTDKLSSVVESLRAEFVAQEQAQRAAKTAALDATIATWNQFNAKSGSFSDEHSSL